ncbi:hypothetical protein HU200_021294 [Digitaria exilis]|uniref:F-box/LRR-repeat protein 15/At3g58940/PEG3-like LRR domain-containing protein n=1 Tax=Digitaria exilis TaxID=1010633 RepID=A0A835KBT4_9POAL|nr:hypothetical protein HU200_021294 [Digitaria exilis]
MMILSPPKEEGKIGALCTVWRENNDCHPHPHLSNAEPSFPQSSDQIDSSPRVEQERPPPATKRARPSPPRAQDAAAAAASAEDRLSALDDAILHAILVRLPLRDAAATTALSRRWPRVFATLPRLLLHPATFNRRGFPDEGCDDFCEDPARWIDALDAVLDGRAAPVAALEIHARFLFQFRDWFRGAFRELCGRSGGLLELSIDNTKHSESERYELPTPIYSCTTLTSLDLYNCRLRVPGKLTGLRAEAGARSTAAARAPFCGTRDTCPLYKNCSSSDAEILKTRGNGDAGGGGDAGDGGGIASPFSTLAVCPVLFVTATLRCPRICVAHYQAYVRSLRLRNVVATDADVRRLISRCSAMEHLEIQDIHRNIVIRSPCLEKLDICSYRPLCISVKKAPRLDTVGLSLFYFHGWIFRDTMYSDEDYSLSEIKEMAEREKQIDDIGNLSHHTTGSRRQPPHHTHTFTLGWCTGFQPRHLNRHNRITREAELYLPLPD